MKPPEALSPSGRRARRRALGAARDLTGKRFGALVVAGPTDQKNRLGEVYWDCHCDCGNHIASTAYPLYRALRRNCGCGKGAPPKVAGKDYGQLTAARWAKMVQAAERAGKKITISQEEAWNWFQYQGACCAITQQRLKFEEARLLEPTPLEPTPRWVHRDVARILIFVSEFRLLELATQIVRADQPVFSGEEQLVPPLSNSQLSVLKKRGVMAGVEALLPR